MRNRLWTIASEHRSALSAGILLQTLQSYVGMFSIVFFQRVIDSLRRGGTDSFDFALGLFIALTALNHLLIYAQEYPQCVFRVGTYLSVKRLAMRKLATIDYRQYAAMDTGTTLQMVENGATSGSAILNDFWLVVVITTLTLPVTLYLIQMYDFVLFLVVMIGYAVLFGAAQLLMRVSKATMERVVSRKEELSSRLARGFMEMVNLRILRRFATEINQVDALADDVVKSEGRIRLVNELFFTGFTLLVFGVEVTVILRQAALISGGESTVGILVALVLFVRTVFAPVSGFTFAYVGYKMNKIPWRRLERFLDLPSDPYLTNSQSNRLACSGNLRLHSVSFRYADRKILNSISFVMETGKHTAIVGSSGAGKTTILRLLLGLLRPDEGSIEVGDTDLSGIDLDEYYRSIAFVSQDAPVLDGTLRENVVGSMMVADHQVATALGRMRLAHLGDKLETEVGERGISLSAGERQRIALTRTLLSSTPLVFLDEPTSALDSETEAAVMTEFFNSMMGRTVVLVAHRLQPVRVCDAIIVVEDGAVVEEGAFRDLVQSKGRFSELWEEQTRQ